MAGDVDIRVHIIHSVNLSIAAQVGEFGSILILTVTIANTLVELQLNVVVR